MSDDSRTGHRTIEELLGAKTRACICEATAGWAAIVDAAQSGRTICDCSVLTDKRPLSSAQVAELSRLLLDQASHYQGRPVYRREPPVPGFVVQLLAGERVVECLLDLHNPSWTITCEDETTTNYCWIGDSLVSLAQELFPECASERSGSVWRQSAIRELKGGDSDSSSATP